MATLDINDISPRREYTASDAQVTFSAPFEFFANADITVYKDNVRQVLDTDYTVSGAGVEGGGSVTFVTPMTGGEKVSVLRDTAVARDVKYAQGGSLPHDVLDNDFAKIITMIQQLERDLARVIGLKVNDPTIDLSLPLAAARANGFVTFGASGELVISSSLPAATAFNQATIGLELWPETAEETNAAVTPSFYYYPPGNVRRYGATGDGTTDDSGAFNQALKIGGDVFVPAGTYVVDDLEPSPATKVSVRGEGSSSVLKSKATPAGDVLTLNTANSSVTGIHFDASAQNDRRILHLAAAECYCDVTQEGLTLLASPPSGLTSQAGVRVTGANCRIKVRQKDFTTSNANTALPQAVTFGTGSEGSTLEDYHGINIQGGITIGGGATNVDHIHMGNVFINGCKDNGFYLLAGSYLHIDNAYLIECKEGVVLEDTTDTYIGNLHVIVKSTAGGAPISFHDVTGLTIDNMYIRDDRDLVAEPSAYGMTILRTRTGNGTSSGIRCNGGYIRCMSNKMINFTIGTVVDFHMTDFIVDYWWENASQQKNILDWTTGDRAFMRNCLFRTHDNVGGGALSGSGFDLDFPATLAKYSVIDIEMLAVTAPDNHFVRAQNINQHTVSLREFAPINALTGDQREESLVGGGVRRRPKFVSGTAAPSAGLWSEGDFMLNTDRTTPASNRYLLGWSCESDGTPGTWNEIWVADASSAPPWS